MSSKERPGSKRESEAHYLRKIGGMSETDANRKEILTTTDRELFRLYLQGAAANPDHWVLANRYPWQARMAIEVLLQKAVDLGQGTEIRILSGHCREQHYGGELARLLKVCAISECKIKVLVWQKTDEGISPFLKTLAKDKQIELRISGTNYLENEVPHFLLIEDYAFRQEAGHEPITSETPLTEEYPEVPARIDFNDHKTGNKLKTLFDILWEQCEH